MVAVPMGVWVGSARRWLASGMGVCPRRQERAATIPYPPRDRKPEEGAFLCKEGVMSKSGVRRVYGPSVRGVLFGHEGLCHLVQSGLGLRVCGAVEGDGLS